MDACVHIPRSDRSRNRYDGYSAAALARLATAPAGDRAAAAAAAAKMLTQPSVPRFWMRLYPLVDEALPTVAHIGGTAGPRGATAAAGAASTSWSVLLPLHVIVRMEERQLWRHLERLLERCAAAEARQLIWRGPHTHALGAVLGEGEAMSTPVHPIADGSIADQSVPAADAAPATISLLQLIGWAPALADALPLARGSGIVCDVDDARGWEEKVLQHCHDRDAWAIGASAATSRMLAALVRVLEAMAAMEDRHGRYRQTGAVRQGGTRGATPFHKALARLQRVSVAVLPQAVHASHGNDSSQLRGAAAARMRRRAATVRRRVTAAQAQAKVAQDGAS